MSEQQVRAGIIVGEDMQEIDRNARAYGWEIGRGRALSQIIDMTPGNPFADPDWRKNVTLGDIVVIYEEENFEQILQRLFTDFKYDLALRNVEDSIRFLEGRRIDKVYFTPDVMIKGMNADLLGVIENNFVRRGIKASDGLNMIG